MRSLATPFAGTVNHLLTRQPVLRDRLAVHAGKSACIDAGAVRLHLSVAADGLLQAADHSKPNGSTNDGTDRGTTGDANAEATRSANVSIRVDPARLPQLLSNMDRAFSYVNISGDADFARAIAEVAQGLRWDAEDDLAPLIGDIAAVRVVQAARDAAAVAKAGSRKLAENLAEYLLEENPTLLYRRAGDDFASAVATLRDDVERLAKRIERLEKTVGSAA